MGVTHSTKSGCGEVVAEACKQTTASRSERPQNDVGMREQPAEPGRYHKWEWRYVPTKMPATCFSAAQERGDDCFKEQEKWSGGR